MEELQSAQETQNSASTGWLLGNDPGKCDGETEKEQRDDKCI